MKDFNQSQISEDIQDSNINQILGNNEGHIYNAPIINIMAASSESLIELDRTIIKILDHKLPSYLQDNFDNQVSKHIKNYLEVLQTSINLHTRDIVDAKLDERLKSNDFKSCLADTIDQVIIREDKAPIDVLAGLITNKLTNDDDYLVNQAIDTLKYLNRNQVNFLGFIHFLQRRIIQVDEKNIENQLEPFYILLEKIENQIDGLQPLYTLLESLKKEVDNEHKLNHNYTSKEKIKEITKSIEELKRKITPNISEIYRKFFNKFLSLEPQKLDVDYLISSNLFYTHYTSPFDQLKINICRALSISEDELLNIFPELSEILTKFDIDSKEILSISSLGDKIGIIVYENIAQELK